MKRALIFLFVILLLASPCFAMDKISVFESDLIKLKIDAYDLDDDKLDYFFPEPFDKNGEWQTNYNDSGVYNLTIAVSDGKEISYKQLQIIIKDKDRPPVFVGLKDSYKVNEEETIKIELNAKDPDGDDVEFVAVNLPEGSSFSKGIFEWKPDFDAVSKEDNLKNKILTKLKLYNYLKKNKKEFIVVFVAKGEEEAAKQNVKIIVKNTNRPPVLKKLKDITISEGGRVELKPEATDPDQDVVSFSYSGAMKSKSHKTGYNDAGKYTVTITASDGKEKVSQDVEITVKNKNRAPELKKIKDKKVYENQTLEFKLKAKDKDDDEITYSAKQMPSGANITGDIFSYTPDFDVTEDSKTYLVTFAASDSDDENKQTAKITVENVNRKPVIKSASNITKAYVNNPVKFSVNAEDPDGDNLTYKWVFGLFDSYSRGRSHTRKFTTTGTKTVKVIVSDGKLVAVKKWKINIVAKKKAAVITTPAQKIYKTYTIE